MKYCKLRIAFSAVCGIICLLLIVLWVRSYGRHYVMVTQSLAFSGHLDAVLHGRLYGSNVWECP